MYMERIGEERDGGLNIDEIREYGLKADFDGIDIVQARTFANRIDVDAQLENHRDILVRKTALMIPDLSGKNSLDIGTGEGRWARFMMSKGSAKVVGIDTSHGMIEIAKERTPIDSSASYVIDDVAGFEGVEFDFANAFFVTNYVQELVPFFRRVSRALTSGGEFIFTVKAIELGEDDKKVFDSYLLPISGKNGSTIFSYPHSQVDYLGAIEKAGFELIGSFSRTTDDIFVNERLNSLSYEINDLIGLCKNRE